MLEIASNVPSKHPPLNSALKPVVSANGNDEKDPIKGAIFCALVALQFGLQPLLVKKFQGEVPLLPSPTSLRTL